MEEPRIDKTVYTGRPENTEGRLEKEIAVYDFLDSLGIEYKSTDDHGGLRGSGSASGGADMQKSFSLQSTENRFLSSADAWREAV